MDTKWDLMIVMEVHLSKQLNFQVLLELYKNKKIHMLQEELNVEIINHSIDQKNLFNYIIQV